MQTFNINFDHHPDDDILIREISISLPLNPYIEWQNYIYRIIQKYYPKSIDFSVVNYGAIGGGMRFVFDSGLTYVTIEESITKSSITFKNLYPNCDNTYPDEKDYIVTIRIYKTMQDKLNAWLEKNFIEEKNLIYEYSAFSIGVIVKVKDCISGKKLDLSQYNTW